MKNQISQLYINGEFVLFNNICELTDVSCTDKIIVTCPDCQLKQEFVLSRTNKNDIWVYFDLETGLCHTCLTQQEYEYRSYIIQLNSEYMLERGNL